jgi:hypothetical protein
MNFGLGGSESVRTRPIKAVSYFESIFLRTFEPEFEVSGIFIPIPGTLCIVFL